MNTAKEPQLPWTPYSEATHLVVGYGPNGSGGVLATAPCWFTAKRYCKQLQPWYPGAKVVQNTPQELDRVHAELAVTLGAR